VTYRDAFERCPRCTTTLEDARSARGCRACGGLWLDGAVLEEMVLAMRPQRPLGRLELAVVARAEPPLPCPACGEPMQATEVHEIPIDRCSQHGVWFDRLELEQALHRVGERGMPARGEVPRGGSFTFVVESPGQAPRTLRVDGDIVKIGRLASAQVQLADPKVSRLHAVIDVRGPDDLVLVDLGSREGTRVNGERHDRVRVRDGDALRVGDTTIRVGFRPSSA
jgi:Zn-finger nucleic acid-binding protein